MAKPKRVYWDSCAWIAYINQEMNIASAIRANCSEMHTFDNQILDQDNRIRVSDEKKLRICKPGDVGNTGTLLEGIDAQ